MPEGKTHQLKASLLLFLSAVGFHKLEASEMVPGRIPPEWNEKTHPIRIAANNFQQLKLANSDEIGRDISVLAEWRASLDFRNRAEKVQLLPPKGDDGLDDLLVNIWEEIRLGHLQSKIPAVPFDKPLTALHMSVVDELIPIKIESKPIGCTILLDGIQRKTTNRTYGMNPKARYTVELKLEGHKDYKEANYAPKLNGRIYKEMEK